jgi:putative DNA primase/helicase
LTQKQTNFNKYVQPLTIQTQNTITPSQNKHGVDHASPLTRKLSGVYDYRDCDGNIAYQKCRYRPKSFSWRRPDINNPGKWIKQGALNGVQRVPYRLPEILSSNDDTPIVITEGEQDCDVLINIGFVATTFGSKEDCLKLLKDPSIQEYLRGRIIWLVADKDCNEENRASGYNAFRKAAVALAPVCREVRLFLLPGHGIKDPHDFVSTHGSTKARELIIALAEKARIFDPHEQTSPVKTNELSISSAEILKCLDSNEDGDALLYQRLMGGRFCYDHTTHDWYKWEANYWKQDRLKEATASIQELIDIYSREARKQSELRVMAAQSGKSSAKIHEQTENRLVRRISCLQTVKRKKDILALAVNGEQSLGISGVEWDRAGWLLPCQNGVVDLKNGNFRPTHQSDFIRMVVPVEWCGLDAPAPNFEDFINQILVDENYQPDTEMVSFIQRLFGYAIIGDVKEHIFPVLWGPRGRNGKGTLLLALNHALGPFSGSINVETLLQSKYEVSGAAPRADLMKLRGTRLIWCSESDRGQQLSVALVKKLCGGDPVTARSPHAKHLIDFNPTHQIFFLTNHKPTIPGGSQDAIWERIKIIPFHLSFVDVPKEPWQRPVDKFLPDKLKHETPGILAWLVRGALRWQTDGLRVPKRVHQATNEYRIEEDTVGRFLSECCLDDPNSAVQASPLYNHYEFWARQNGYTPMSATSFGRQIGSMVQKQKSGGVVMYPGIRLMESTQGQF